MRESSGAMWEVLFSPSSFQEPTQPFVLTIVFPSRFLLNRDRWQQTLGRLLTRLATMNFERDCSEERYDQSEIATNKDTTKLGLS